MSLFTRLRRQSPAVHMAIAASVIVAAALLHVHLRLEVIQVGYAISQEHRVRRHLLDQNQKLRLELSTRRDPYVIERRARAELQMAPPDPSAIRVLRRPRTAATATVAIPVPRGAAPGARPQ